MDIRFMTMVAITLILALSRLVPHPWNFTPVTALALFGGAYFASKKAAFTIPLAALVISDLLLGQFRYGYSFAFFFLLPFSYGCFLLTVYLGCWTGPRLAPLRISSAALASSVLFFLVSNFGFWLLGWYPMTWGGLLECYEKALPFFKNNLAGDFLYTFALFGGMALAQNHLRMPSCQLSESRLV